MLELLRKYQRYIFIFVTVIIIASFSFFGTFSTFDEGEKRVDRVIGHAIDGSPMHLLEVKQLAHFISTDREDMPQGRGGIPNLTNDGVVRYDFLGTHLADLLVESYFEPLRGEIQMRLDKAKRFRPYAHPEAPFLSARAVWERFLPSINQELDALQKEEVASPGVFSRLSVLCQQQSYFHPEVLRRMLVYQHQQCPWLNIDQRLSYEDLSLFGFHTAAEWFGHDFLDLVAQFILNGAAAAQEKGYRVSLEEAKGDLIHNFHVSMERIKQEVSYQQHLRMLGFDEKTAAQLWQKVLLFRRYFQDVGEATFIDRLPYKDFAGYAMETAKVNKYEWPIHLASLDDLLQFQAYLKAVALPLKDPLALPKEFRSVDEVANDHPELVQTLYRAKVAELSKGQIGLRASLKEVWEWELNNWDKLKKEFSFLSPENSFKSLEKLSGDERAKVDAFAREALVDLNPGWIEEAISAAAPSEKSIVVSGNGVQMPNVKKGKSCAEWLEKALQQDPEAVAILKCYSDDGKHFIRFDQVERVEDRHILTFEKAKEALKPLVEKEGARAKVLSVLKAMDGREKNEWKSGEGPGEYYACHRFAAAAETALAALKKDPNDPEWAVSTGNPIIDQFTCKNNT